MPAFAGRPTPMADYGKLREIIQSQPTAPKTDDLLQTLIEEVRGLRRDLKAAEWRQGTAPVLAALAQQEPSR